MACVDPGAPGGELDRLPGRTVKSKGIETIAEPVMPALRRKGLSELLRGARRSALQPILVGAEDNPRSGEFVHPDLVLEGTRVALLYTGYPVVNSSERTYDSRAENPSLVTSLDWTTWRPPGGLQNPIFPPPPGGYNSDGSLLLDPGRRVAIAFNREVSRVDGTERNIIEFRRSRDGGATWGPTRETLTVPAHRAVSPDFLMEGPNYGMWVVNAGADGCRARSSTIERYLGTPLGVDLDSIAWGAPRRVEWTQPGWTHWHIDVAKLGDFYFGLSAAYPTGTNCTQIELFAALSSDGIHWVTLAEPIERVRDVRASTATLYRATAAYDGRTQLLSIAYSAASAPTFAWENYRRTYDGIDLVAVFKEFGSAGKEGTPRIAQPTPRQVGDVIAYRAFVRRTLSQPH